MLAEAAAAPVLERQTPSPLLPEMRFRPLTDVPPMTLADASTIVMPLFWLPSAVVPLAAVPMKLPVISLFEAGATPVLVMKTPELLLPEITLREPLTDPPTVLPEESLMKTPSPLGNATVPAALVP